MSVDDDLLLHPELLSDEQIRGVLQDRYLKIAELSHMSRQDMLQVFHQYCVPYAQRQYRDSGRGKMLNRNRGSDSCSLLKSTQNGSYSHSIENPHKNRLRPPQDTLCNDVKRIKLSNGVQKPSQVDISLKRKTPSPMDTSEAVTQGPSPQKKARIPITWP